MPQPERSSSPRERIIPIVVEDSGHQNRHNESYQSKSSYKSTGSKSKNQDTSWIGSKKDASIEKNGSKHKDTSKHKNGDMNNNNNNDQSRGEVIVTQPGKSILKHPVASSTPLPGHTDPHETSVVIHEPPSTKSKCNSWCCYPFGICCFCSPFECECCDCCYLKCVRCQKCLCHCCNYKCCQ